MKKILYIISLVFISVIFYTSCNDRTYATELKNEKILIAEYIKRNNITVINELPADSTDWKENVYYKNSDGLYFHLVSPGVGEKVAVNDVVVTRFIQFTLNSDSDSLRNWTTIDYSYPNKFNYGDYSLSCTAFHQAVGYMKRNDAVAKIIVPSKIGFKENWTPATPMVYDIVIKLRK